MPPALGISNGHGRTIQGLIGGGGLASGIGHYCQMHGQSLDELHIGTNQPVELGALGQGREGVSEVAAGVAVEVPFASENREKRAKMARVMTSLSEREASGPGRLFGGWEWQKSSAMT
jgi:hypothetical protein